MGMTEEEKRNELTFTSEGFLIPPTPPAPPAPDTGTARVVGDVNPQITDAVTQGARSGRRRARRFHADTPFVLSLLLLLILLMAAASFYVSFWGVFEAAAWAVGNAPALQFAVPLMLDVAIIAFTLSLFIEREREEKVWGTWLAISAFTAVSAFANVTHAYAVSTAENSVQMTVGAVIAGGAPVLLAFASDKIAKKVFKTAGNEIED